MLFGLPLLPLLLMLGFWQLDRAEEKQRWQAAAQRQAALPALNADELHRLAGSAPPTALDESGPDPLLFRRAQVQGRFDPQRYWLLDNQVHQGRAGYRVIAPFVTRAGDTLLVDRGWVAAPAVRSQLPQVSLPEGRLTLSGRLNTPQYNALTRNTPQADQWPRRVQQLQLSEVEQALQRPVLGWLLELSPAQPAALTVAWRQLNISPAKHQGYAVQWFAMSLALLVALVAANVRFKNKPGSVPETQTHFKQ